MGDGDVTGAADLLASAKDVKETTPGTFTGTIDFTKAGESALGDEDLAKALRAKATALPFTAVLDAQGRLGSLVVEVPAAGEYPAHRLEVVYADYGAAKQPTKPSGKVVEAPAEAYEMLS